MQMHRDDIDLAAELRALRPRPQRDFAEKLDVRAAEGFPRERQQRRTVLLGRIEDAFGTVSPRRLVLPASAIGLTALVAATAVILLGESAQDSGSLERFADHRDGGSVAGEHPLTEFSAPVGQAAAGDAVGTGESARLGRTAAPLAGQGTPRKIERDAEMVLRTEPDDFGEAVKRVFSTVHAVNGIVLSSEAHDRKLTEENGPSDEANASFELLIPSARLSDALSSLSRIADVRSRHESTLDITAPTVTADERLDDSQARIDGLLAQLASAESEEERVVIESELRGARREAAAQQAQLDRLQRRAGFAQVSLRIESGADRNSSGAGRWGIGDALDDAARILTVAAGVTLIGLAVLSPLALIAVAVWLVYRMWVRRRRESALAQAA